MEEIQKNQPDSLNSIDPKMMARIQSLRLMDDDFMTIVFAGDNKLTEFVLKIILNRDDLIVKRSVTQQEKHNIFGRSVRLDVLAEDETGEIYNIEIQRTDKGASEKRARYNQSMLDSHTLKRNDDFSALPEVYIIFITENDYLRMGKPTYSVQKTFDCVDKRGKTVSFDDGIHIIYVNGAYRGSDAIGKLMHDFNTADAGKMYYNEIAARVRLHKQDTEEVGTVCRVFEEYGEEVRAEARAERNIEFAEKLIRQNKMTPQEIAEITDVSIDQVEHIMRNIAVSAPLQSLKN